MDESVSSIDKGVLDIVSDCVGIYNIGRSITPRSSIRELLIDSLKMMQIVYEIETSFDIEIPEHTLFQLETLQDLILLVQLCLYQLPSGAKNGSAHANQG